METCLKGIAEHFPLTEKELRGYSSLGLAYIGDCIFELFVRTMVVTKGNDKANHYHQKTIGYVNAAAQTEMMEIIKPLLTDEEKAVFYAAKQAQKKYQLPFVQAYQYCVDSAKCYDAELEACVSLVDILRNSI